MDAGLSETRVHQPTWVGSSALADQPLVIQVSEEGDEGDASVLVVAVAVVKRRPSVQIR